MTKALLKNTFREITNTKARFISIMLIVALGVGFFVGVKCTNPSMTHMADRYYSETRLMDFRLLSNVGFDEDDVKAVSQTNGVKYVMPSYYTDVKLKSDGSGDILRLMCTPYSYENNESLNQIQVKEGRLPEKSGEIAIENAFFDSYGLGEKLVFDEKAGDKDTKDSIKRLDYTIVGFIRSPMYISFERGTTTVGNGKLGGFGYISEEDFNYERYTELFATLDESGDVSAFSDEYEENIDNYENEFEELGKQRSQIFKEENIDKAQKELDDKKKEYEEGKEKAEKELKDAKKKIEDGEKEYDEKIAQAEKELSDAQKKISDGEDELSYARSQYENGKITLEKELEKAKSEIDKGYEEYNKSKEEFDKKSPELLDGIEALKSGIVTAASYALNQVISFIPDELEDIKAQLVALSESVTYENANDVLYGVQNILIEAGYGDYAYALDEAIATVGGLQSQLNELEETYYTAESELAAAKAQLDEAQKQYDDTKAEKEKELSDAKSQIEDGEYQLVLSKKQLEDGRAQLESEKKKGKEEIEKGKADYKKAKNETEDKLKEGQEKIDDAQKKINEVEDPKWYVFTRDDNPGYSTFIDNCDRVDSVAVVFPLFFLLVAMLVCLTTMTRLVEEKRTEIGTFKALGYSNTRIIWKFLIYSSLAAVIGSALGCAIGIPVLPRAIYACYGIMYDMPDISVVIPVIPLVLGFTAAVIACVFVSVSVCYLTLKETAASLMRPKAPKAGKRILLERISLIWSRLSFTSKVTQRNLFRYKSRLFMTVIGIAGCTALIVAGFGLYDSISDVVDIQYNDLNRYNISFIADDKDGSIETLEKALKEDSRITNEMPLMVKSISVSSDKEKMSGDIYLCVISDKSRYDDFQQLRNRVTKEKLEIEKGKAIITEKLASLLSVSVGDFIYLDSDKDKKIEISGIAENYIYGYIYIDPDTAKEVYDKDMKYNIVYAVADDLDEENESLISSDYLERDDVASVAVMTTAIKSFKDTISSLKMITFILVICAGALAIVVLYNLTNINLTERRREIATIKVLGFKYSETAAFVYRENIILTLMGIALGLILGVFLTRFIVFTVEIDKIMFGRNIYFPTFLYAAVGTVVFSVIVNFIMYFRIKKISMIESLKSVE